VCYQQGLLQCCMGVQGNILQAKGFIEMSLTSKLCIKTRNEISRILFRSQNLDSCFCFFK